jgi:hypothetical protein
METTNTSEPEPFFWRVWLTVPEAKLARKEARRVEWWDQARGGWRRGLIVSMTRDGALARVLETGHTRAKARPTCMLRLADPATERSAP